MNLPAASREVTPPPGPYIPQKGGVQRIMTPEGEGEEGIW
jgi:hypothetical protein